MATRDDTAWLGIHTLTPRERARLAGILSRLSSPFAGERDAAATLAAAFVARHGLSPSSVRVLVEPVVQAPAAPPPARTAAAPAARAAVKTVTLAPRQERRRGANRLWRGYDRRRQLAAGLAVNMSL